MSQLSKLLRHAADTSLIPSDSIKPSVITRHILNHNSPSTPANIGIAATDRRTRRTNMADDDKKNEKKPTAQEPGIPKLVTLRKKPSWINIENCKNDSLFRQSLASPEQKEFFEGSMIPLPSPNDGAKRGQIYSPARIRRTASSTSNQRSASQESTTSAWSHKSVIEETKDQKEMKVEEIEGGFTSELGKKSKARRKKIGVGRPENNNSGKPPRKAIQQWIRNEANAHFTLGMPLGQLEEKLRDGVLEREMDEHSGEWIRAYGLADDE